MLYDRSFSPKLKAALYGSYVRQAILHRSEAWYLKESVTGISRRTEKSVVRRMCGVQLKDRKRAKDLKPMSNLNETNGCFAMANSVRWHGHALKREDDHV